MNPHYYLMKGKKILRLESETTFASLPLNIRETAFQDDSESMDQEQANWRVVIFRDEIMEYDEYVEWMATGAHLLEEEEELELIAN